MSRKAISVLLIAALALGFACGYVLGRRSGEGRRSVAGSPQSSGEPEQLGPWKAEFRVPGRVELPSKSPKIRWEFSRTDFSNVGSFQVIVTNLDDRGYRVEYSVYGYDAKGRRISQGGEIFSIGAHESVVRSLFLDSQDPNLRPGTTFGIVMRLE